MNHNVRQMTLLLCRSSTQVLPALPTGLQHPMAVPCARSARTSVSLPFPDLRNVTAPWKDISLTQPLQCQRGRNVRATPLVPEILSFRYLIRGSGATPSHQQPRSTSVPGKLAREQQRPTTAAGSPASWRRKTATLTNCSARKAAKGHFVAVALRITPTIPSLLPVSRVVAIRVRPMSFFRGNVGAYSSDRHGMSASPETPQNGAWCRGRLLSWF